MKLVLLKLFPTHIEAESVQILLKNQGIVAILQSLRPGSSGFWGNGDDAELYVRAEDLERAKEIIGI